MRAAVIFGLGTSHKDLRPFRQNSSVEWLIGLPSAADGAGAVVMFGGDGTLHRHLSSLVNLGLPILIVPAGSGNDFARAIGLRKVGQSLAAWRRFVEHRSNERRVDLGLITPLETSEKPAANTFKSFSAPMSPKYFSCVAGCGLDAEVTRRANQLPRWLRGHGGYALSLPKALTRFRSFSANISIYSPEQGGATRHLDASSVLVACANTPVYGGGMKIAPDARLDDGKLDVCHIKDVHKLKLFCLFPTVYFGKHLSMEEVNYLAARRVRIETEAPVDVYADGEYVCRTPVEIGVAPLALTVITP